MKRAGNGFGRGHWIGVAVSLAVHASVLAAALYAGTGAEADEAGQADDGGQVSKIFCRYIEDSRLYEVEVPGGDWIAAEEEVCGASVHGIVLPGAMLDAALLVIADGAHPVIRAQRESCSCSEQDRLPLLKDVGIVQAARLGNEARATAVPRIMNTPELGAPNTITTRKDQQQAQKLPPKPVDTPTLDDILAADAVYDPSRALNEKDTGGSADGSRSSKSRTGVGDPYMRKVQAKLDNSMNAPAGIPKTQLNKLNADIWIKIDATGYVVAWEFTRRSGNQPFDRMIETTIRSFMRDGNLRFAPPPEHWRFRMINVTVDGKGIR